MGEGPAIAGPDASELEAMGLLVTAVGIDGRIRGCNRVCEELSGFTRDEVIGKSFWDVFVPAEGLERAREQFAALLTGGSSGRFTNWWRTRSGQRRLIEWSVSLRPDGPLIIGVGVDVTENQGRAQAEDLLRLQRDLALKLSSVSDLDEALPLLLEACCRNPVIDSGGIYVVDSETGDLHLVEHRGLSAEFVRDVARYSSASPHAALVRAGMPIYKTRREIEEITADPLKREGLTALVMVPVQHHGEVVAVLNLGSHEHSEIPPSYRDTLETLASQIGGVVTRVRAEEDQRGLREQLLQAQRVESVGRLAGGIAHDFNNLLTVIEGYGMLLRSSLGEDHELTPKAREITRAARRAADLTRQLLAFSRRQVLEPHVLDLNAVLLEMGTMLHRLIGEDVNLEILPAEDLSRVRVDPSQFGQVIVNLAVNARDAMPDGGTLTLETANVVLDEEFVARNLGARVGPHVMLVVADTGEGMEEETQDRLFEPFFSTKEPGKGTGLGLSTVYGIVKQSDGCIYVKSEPGKGTTFRVYLPALDEPVDYIAARADSGQVADGHETILLVEDEDGVRRLAKESLEGAGYDVLTAADGREALELATGHPGEIHLLLTDVVMPRLGGVELARALGQDRSGLRVLYVSGYAEEAILDRGVLQAGMHYLPKPFTPVVLTRKVRQVLDGRA